MKKKILTAYLLLAALLLGGCAAQSAGGTVATPPATTMPVPITAPPAAQATAASSERVEDYFPILDNVRYTYEGVGNEFASYVSFAEFFAGNKLQTRVNNGGTVSSKVYKWENGKLTRVLSVGEAYERENMLDDPEKESEVLLQEPLMVGTTWDALGGRRTITGVNVSITTPSGNYDALEVTTQGADAKTTDYYAKGIGLVKSVFQSSEAEISSSLAEITSDSPFLQVARLYYPGTGGTGRFYREVQLSIPTNMTLAAAMEAAYKVEPGSKAVRVFSPGTKVLHLSRDAQNVVLLDLNKAFATEMIAGDVNENGVLHSAADTFAELYQAEKVLLTIEGTPYKSANISMKEGETLNVEKPEAQIIID